MSINLIEKFSSFLFGLNYSLIFHPPQQASGPPHPHPHASGFYGELSLFRCHLPNCTIIELPFEKNENPSMKI